MKIKICKISCGILLFLLLFLLIFENFLAIQGLYSKFLDAEKFPYHTISDVQKDHVYSRTRKMLINNEGFLTADYSPWRKRSRLESLVRGSGHSGPPKKHLNFFSNTVLAEAVYAEYKAFRSPKSIVAIRKYLDQILNDRGIFQESLDIIDNCMIGYLLLQLFEETKDMKYYIAVNQIKNFLDGHPRNQSGLIPYRGGFPDLILIDTLGMICPFLSAYGYRFDDIQAKQLAYTLLRDFYYHGVCRETGLPFHGYGEKKMGIGLRGWTRGVGWYVIGLVNSLPYFPADSKEYDHLRKQLNEIMEVVVQFQRSDGCWDWQLTDIPQKKDTSGTAMFGYAMAKGMRLGLLPEHYESNMKSALNGIAQNTSELGKVYGAFAECHGLSVYPQVFGHTAWGQGYSQLFLIEAAKYYNLSRMTRH